MAILHPELEPSTYAPNFMKVRKLTHFGFTESNTARETQGHKRETTESGENVNILVSLAVLNIAIQKTFTPSTVSHSPPTKSHAHTRSALQGSAGAFPQPKKKEKAHSPSPMPP